MSSFISPVRPVETGVPWGWNPAATFQASFIAAQENQRAQEKMAMEADLMRILLPQKQAEAEFNLKKLAYESKLIEREYRNSTKEYDERYKMISGSGGSGAGSNVAGNVGSAPRTGSNVATLVQNYFGGGAAAPSGGGGGGKILGQGHTGDDDY